MLSTSKRATIIPGRLDISDEDVKAKKASVLASISYGGPTALAFTPYVDKVPASRTVAPLAGAYGSVAAAQDVCAADLKCLGVQAHQAGSIALLYPGCARPEAIGQVHDAPGTTTWAKQPV